MRCSASDRVTALAFSARTSRQGHANGRRADCRTNLEDAANLNDFRIAFRSAFGTVDELVAEALFALLLNGLHTDPRKPLHSGTANLALALTHEPPRMWSRRCSRAR